LLNCIKVFVAVVDRGGFAAAGRSLDMSPPVVTRLVSELEAHLGARLLQRSTRRVALTETGAAYLAQVREVLLQIEDAEAVARASSSEAKGTLRLLTPPSFSSYLLAQLLPSFMQRYPDVNVDVNHGFAEVADTAYDISVLFAAELPGGDFIAHRLARPHLLLCAAPDYLRRHGVPRHPQELAEHRCIVVNAAKALLHWRLQGPGGASFSLEPRPVLAAPMMDPLLRASIEGLGIAALPSFVVEQALASGQLCQVLPGWLMQCFGIYAALPTRKLMPVRTRVFLDFLRQHFEADSEDPWLARIEGQRAQPPVRAA